jgi:hypothetical protein
MDPFDGGFITLFMVIAVLGALGTIAWWVFVFLIAKNAFTALTRDLDRAFPDLQRQIRAYQTMAQRNPQAQALIVSKLSQAWQQMGQLDSLHRQRYEVRAGELMGMAAQAGIDWQPPSY